MELELVEGRNLSWDLNTDLARKYIINEEAVKFLELEEPVGKIVKANFGESEIIGVVKDFHFNSLHNKIGPLAIAWIDWWASVANIKVCGRNLPETIKYLDKTWYKFCPEFPFEYKFLDQSFARQYDSESRLSRILQYFAFLAIFIACLGLFGLASFIAEQKTKEIGIRKVLGSSSRSILFLLSKEFSRWVILSNVIAWPVAWFILKKWLQNFAYHTNINWIIFVLAGIVALLIALATVSYQAIKAAQINPADSLKHE